MWRYGPSVRSATDRTSVENGQGKSRPLDPDRVSIKRIIIYTVYINLATPSSQTCQLSKADPLFSKGYLVAMPLRGSALLCALRRELQVCTVLTDSFVHSPELGGAAILRLVLDSPGAETRNRLG